MEGKKPHYAVLSLNRRDAPPKFVAGPHATRSSDESKTPVHDAPGDEAPVNLRAAEDDVAMELYATGFNAWNQLYFEPLTPDEEPNDIFEFTKVLSGRNLDRVEAHLTYTCGTIISQLPRPGLISVVKHKNKVCSAGRTSDLEIYAYENPKSSATAVRANGEIAAIPAEGSEFQRFLPSLIILPRHL